MSRPLRWGNRQVPQTVPLIPPAERPAPKSTILCEEPSYAINEGLALTWKECPQPPRPSRPQEIPASLLA